MNPPYNTGNDFIYPDNYAENLSTYLEYTGQVDSEGKKFSTNTETDGRFHSKWMNMMYPRLFLAKNLLREDGVIFISIDDAEVDNLRKICNEIFGEENFVSQIIIQSNKRGQTYKEIAKTHEYLLLYAKSDEFEIFELDKEEDSLPFEDKDGKYDLWEYGKYDLWELRNRNPKFGRFNRPNLYFPIYVSPNTLDDDGLAKVSLIKSKEYSVEVTPKNSEGVDGCWRWEPKTVNEAIGKGYSVLVAKQRRDGEWNIYQKSRKNTTKAKTLWNDSGVISEQGTIELGKLGLKNMFDHPKPVELIKRVVKIGLGEEDVVLDFFAGSCTTSQAVLEANKELGGHRKYICVQLPEPNHEDSIQFKAGFKTISDISKERIRRVAKKIKEENPLFESDLGFKSFKLKPSNFKIWDTAIERNQESLQSALDFHIDHISPKSIEEGILFEILLKAGFELTTPIQELKIENKSVFSIADGELLICLEKKLTHELIKGIAEKNPSRVILLDEGFQNNDQLKTNAVQIMKSKNVLNFRTV